MKKKILSVLFCLCMVMALLPTTAFAAGTTEVGIYLRTLIADAPDDNTITGSHFLSIPKNQLQAMGLVNSSNNSYNGYYYKDGYGNWIDYGYFISANAAAYSGTQNRGSDEVKAVVNEMKSKGLTKKGGISFDILTSNTISPGVTWDTLSPRPNGDTSSSPWHLNGELRVCTVTFDLNGGNVASGKTSADYTRYCIKGTSTNSGLPVAPTRVGYTFGGWYTSQTDGDLIDDIEGLTSDKTYYAHWTANTYTVTSAPTTNGTFNVDITNAAANETVTITASPASGYEVDTVTVKGADNTPVDVTKTDDTYTFTMPAKAVTVEVTFRVIPPTTYTVALTGGDGATGDAPTQAATAAGGTFTLPANTFTKAGYTFAGWNDGRTTYQAGDTYTMPAENVIFTAQWTANPTDPSEPVESVAFSYAYDVQRSPAYPKAGENVEFWNLDTPMAGGGPSGSWTLTRIGTYSAVKAEHHAELEILVQSLAEKYDPALNKDTIVIHELKNNGTHVAYGVVTAYDTTNGYAAFIGGSASYGYLLSKNQKNTSDTVTVTAGSITDGSLSYTVTFNPNGGSVSPTSAFVSAGGTLSSLPTPTRSSYTFNGWYTEATGGTQVTTGTAFTDNTTIYAQWTYSGSSSSSSGGSSTPPTYKVESEVSKDTDGSVSFSKRSAKKGDDVTITVTPDRYYKVDGVTVKDSSGNEIAVTDNKDGTFTFKMPASRVTVKPVFSWDNPFADVDEDAYYAPAVEWALKNDVTNGTGDGTAFSPDAGCTRAQIVTFLWKAAGCPEPAGANSFTDVSTDAYYAKAVAWAVEQGITGGTGGGKFSPNEICTRSQSLTFLYRAAGSPEVFDNIVFSDVAAGSYYSDAVVWAAQNGVTSGTGDGTTFSPGADCTRAQIMTFLYRWLVK